MVNKECKNWRLLAMWRQNGEYIRINKNEMSSPQGGGICPNVKTHEPWWFVGVLFRTRSLEGPLVAREWTPSFGGSFHRLNYQKSWLLERCAYSSATSSWNQVPPPSPYVTCCKSDGRIFLLAENTTDDAWCLFVLQPALWLPPEHLRHLSSINHHFPILIFKGDRINLRTFQY